MKDVIDFKDEKLKHIYTKGCVAQRKTIEGIFAFAAAVLELKQNAGITQGGSDFSEIASEWWGISQPSVSCWVAIAQDTKLSNSVTKFPPSWGTLYQLTTLTDQQFTLALERGLITPETTRKQIENFKKSLTHNKSKAHAEKMGIKTTVYIMQCEGNYKIGFTNNVYSRLKQLQTGNPFKITVVSTFTTFESTQLETFLHKELQEFHVRGEWYNCDLNTITDLLNEMLIHRRFNINIENLTPVTNLTGDTSHGNQVVQ